MPQRCLTLQALICVFAIGILPLSAEPENVQVYHVARGDTLAGLAERYFGGEENVPELLKYNGIDNPLSVTEGTLLALPGQQRVRVQEAFECAESDLEAALAAKADVFAEEVLKEAIELLRKAEIAWDETAYLKAEGHCLLSAAHAREAHRLADERAPTDRECIVNSVDGPCEVAAQDRWVALKEGVKIPVASRLRTGEGGRIELLLYDGTRVQLGASGEMMVEEMLEDRRTGKMSMRLRLLLGEIFTRMKKRKTPDSKYEIHSGDAATAIRGTSLRVKHRDSETRVMTLTGAVATGNARGHREVPAGSGLILSRGRKPRRPMPLLPPPDTRVPSRDSFVTARQVILFRWESVGNRPFLQRFRLPYAPFRVPSGNTYHLEVAKDADFNHLVTEVTTDATTAETKILAPGHYFWRLSTVDKRGLEGPWSDVAEFTIEQQLTVELVSSRTLVTHGNRLLAAPETVFSACPADSDTSTYRVEYAVNDGPFVVEDQGVSLSAEGAYRIRARGVGRDGAAGNACSMSVFVDATRPNIEILLGGAMEAEDGGVRVSVTLDCSDNIQVDRVEVSLDGMEFRPYSEPLSLDGLRSHNLVARCFDLVGNASRVRRMQIQAVGEQEQ